MIHVVIICNDPRRSHTSQLRVNANERVMQAPTYFDVSMILELNNYINTCECIKIIDDKCFDTQ